MMTTVDPRAVERVPPIVDLDAHVVEPPDVWSARLPARYRDVGPRIEYLRRRQPEAGRGRLHRAPGTEGPLVAWWFYEDHQSSVKRLIAAAGYPADEMQLDGRHLRRDAPRLLAAGRPASPTWTATASRRSSASRTTRGSAARSSCGARTASWPCCASRPTTTGWSKSGAAAADGRLDPALPGAAVGRRARRRRGAAQRGARRARGRLHASCPPTSACPASTAGYWEPFFACLRGDRHGRLPCTSGRARRPRRHRPTRRTRSPPRIIFGNSVGEHDRLHVLRRAAPPPRPEAAVRREPDRLDPLPARARRRRLGDPPGWSDSQLHCPEPPSTYYYRQIHELLLQGPGRASSCSTGWASTTSCSRPTTRTRTAPGRVRSGRGAPVRAPRRPSRSARSPAATPSGCSTCRSGPEAQLARLVLATEGPGADDLLALDTLELGVAEAEEVDEDRPVVLAQRRGG